MVAKFLPGDLAQAATIARLGRVSVEAVEAAADRLGLSARRGGWLPAFLIWSELERLEARQHKRYRRAKLRAQPRAARRPATAS